jgi:broad specificity phosphatase PhoE/predicted kinase
LLQRPVHLEPIVLVMVGKPARGKSYTARKVCRYLNWLGFRAKLFNVGAYRRDRLGAGQHHRFFDPDNPQGRGARRQMAEAAMNDMLDWLRRGGNVGIYDATNSTRARRSWVRDTCDDAGVAVVFLELVCEDPSIIEANIRETKVTSPDYEGRDPDEAVADFRARLAHYERMYEPLDDDKLSYIRVVDVGRQVQVNRIRGFIEGRVVTLLMNLHISPRPIYLSRHGESLYNLDGRIGGDSSLSPSGRRYAVSLAEFMREEPGYADMKVWTSTLQRTIETAGFLDHRPRHLKILDEIDAGVCDGLTYAQIEETMPVDFAARKADKLRYRYPRGESYQDVIARLEAAIVELERSRKPVLVIAHQAVHRALYAYFRNEPPDACPHLSIPLHTVIKLTPKAYGCVEERFALPPSPNAHPSAGTGTG